MFDSSALEIDVPAVFAPLWERHARYKGAYGGRASGKSHDRAQHLIVEMLRRPVRAVCIREVQNSLKDSVKQLLEDTIQRMGVGHLFDITREEIRGPHKGLIIFRGMKDMNAESIKSLEGFNIAWPEEAQALSQRSLDLLLPTIRAPGSEIWFTWNPRFKTDPVDKLLRGVAPTDAIVVKANWSDNPFFPDALRDDMERDRREDPERAAHVWDGAYEAESDRQFIKARDVWAARSREAFCLPVDEVVMGVDVAREGDDASVICIRRGRDARSVKPEIYRKLDTMEFVGRITAAIQRHRPDAVFLDEGGMGGPVLDRLLQLGFDVTGVNFGRAPDFGLTQIKTRNKRAEMWATMREWLVNGAIPDDDALEAELTGPTFSYDADNRIVLEPKDKMKARGLSSPDIADALALTFAHPVVARGEDDRLAEVRGDSYDPMER